jgi:glycosyltransferase involved in cell wall biosynthesis
LITSFPPVKGGEATYAQDFVSAMEKYMHEKIDSIYVLTHSEGEGPEIYERRGKIHILRVFNSLSLWDRNIAFLKLFTRIRNIQPNVVHLEYSTIPNGRYGGILGESLFVLFLLLRLLRVPLYVTLHSVWLPDQARERICQKTKNRIISILGVLYLKLFMSIFARIPNRLFILVNKSRSLVTKRFSQEFNIPVHKIREEIHGVWLEPEIKSAQVRSKNILCLGVINPSKGYEYAIQAMSKVLKKFPESALKIAGSPPPTNYKEGKRYIESLRQAINKNHLGCCITLDERYLTEHEFADYVRTAGIVVLSYLKVVGASGIMHMAMRQKVPIIVAGSGLLFEELSEFVPVVPAMNAEALSDKIVQIFSDEDYSNQVIENYSRYLEEHDWRRTAENIYGTYLESF